MKKNYLKLISSIMVSLLVIVGCQKAIPDQPFNSEIVSLSKNGHDGHKDECRLISYTDEFEVGAFTYNQKGLLDEWQTSAYDGYFKMEYNARGRLAKSRLYSGGVLVNTIIFFYRNNQVVKETWYNGDTQEKADEVFYSYDRNGLIRKSESFMNDYYTSYKNSPEGNVLEWNYYVGGNIFYKALETYNRPHHKNPYLAIPGLDYGFIYINAAIFQSRWDETSETVIFYDEAGNPEVIYDEDPQKTLVNFNQHNYVTEADFFDVVTQEYFLHIKYGYENCGSDDKDKALSAPNLSPVNTRKINPLKLFRKGSAKSIKEQAKEFRQQLKNIKN